MVFHSDALVINCINGIKTLSDALVVDCVNGIKTLADIVMLVVDILS